MDKIDLKIEKLRRQLLSAQKEKIANQNKKIKRLVN